MPLHGTAVQLQNWKTVYESKRITVANGTTNLNVATTHTELFDNVNPATYLSLRTNVAITIRLNSATNDAIVLASTDSPFEITHERLGMLITNIFITAAAGDATIDIEIS